MLSLRRFLVLLLVLVAALGAAQTILPFDVAVQEGTQPVGTLDSLKADDADIYTLNTVSEAGSGHQVASILAQFNIPAGTPSALLHAVTGASLPSRTYVQVWLYHPTNGNPNLGSIAIPGTTSANGVVEYTLTGDQLAQYRDATTGRLYVQFRMYRTYAANDNPTVSFRIGQLAILKPILPTAATPLEGTITQGGATSLQAVDYDFLEMQTAPASGSQVASLLATYTVPVGAPGAVLHAGTEASGSGVVVQAWLYNPSNNANPYLGVATIPSSHSVDIPITAPQLAQCVDPATGRLYVQFRAYRSTTPNPYPFTWWTDQLVLYAHPVPPPAAPSGLTATAASSSAINLSWTDNATTETGYLIERKTGAGAFAQVGTAPANATTFADLGLAASTSYVYRVRAQNSGGESGYSNEATGTTPFDPAPPKFCSAYSTGSSSIRIYWDSVPGANGYRIYRSTSSGARASGSLVATVNNGLAGTLFWDDSNRPAGVDYFYQVTAFNGGVETDPSNEDSVSPVGGVLPYNQSDAVVLQAARQLSGEQNVYVLTPDGRVIDPSGSGASLQATYDRNDDQALVGLGSAAVGAPNFWDDFLDKTGSGGSTSTPPPLRAEGAYQKYETTGVFNTRLNGAYAEFSLPSPNSMSMGPVAHGLLRDFIPNSLCAYVGISTTSAEGVVPKTGCGIDAGVQYYPAYNGAPNRYTPVLRIADGRDNQYTKLLVLNYSNLNSVSYLPMNANDQAYATVKYVVDRSPARLVKFKVSIWLMSNGTLTGLRTLSLIASAPFKTTIQNVGMENPRAKNVISLAQNDRNATGIRFNPGPPIASWPNGYYADGSYANGVGVTRERLIDGADSPDPDNLVYWRDYYGSGDVRTARYVSPRITRQTLGGIEPTTVLYIQH